jgi:hypothetical protein
MKRFLLVLEGRAAAHHYHLLVGDILGRRLGAQRVLRSAWIVESDTCENVYRSILYYTPCEDGVLVVPLTEDRFARNLRSPIEDRASETETEIETGITTPLPAATVAHS